jgi:hypothetical protein
MPKNLPYLSNNKAQSCILIGSEMRNIWAPTFCIFIAKGQLISKGNFSVFNSPKKQT